VLGSIKVVSDAAGSGDLLGIPFPLQPLPLDRLMAITGLSQRFIPQIQRHFLKFLVGQNIAAVSSLFPVG